MTGGGTTPQATVTNMPTHAIVRGRIPMIECMDTHSDLEICKSNYKPINFTHRKDLFIL